MPRSAGFTIDVPVTLTIAVRGATQKEALRIASAFAAHRYGILEDITPEDLEGFELPTGVTITEASMEASAEDSAEVLDELEADDQDAD